MKLEIKTECSHIETFCVYQQWFYKVFLSPCSKIIYTIMFHKVKSGLGLSLSKMLLHTHA